MGRALLLSPTRRLAAVGVCAGLSFAACTSTEQLDSIESRLAEIQRQIQQLQRDAATAEDLAALEEKVTQETAKLLRSGADVSVDLDTVTSRIGELEQQIEESLHRLELLSQQLATTNQELKTMPRGPRGAAAEPPTGGPSEGPPSPAAADPETLYQEAYGDYREGSYDLSILGFEEYLESYPSTELADNAAYWLAESYFAQGRFNQAIAGFTNVLSKYPRSEKIASAMLKRGFAHLQLGQRDRGMDELRAVVRTHPSSEEAAIARQQLETLEGQR